MQRDGGYRRPLNTQLQTASSYVHLFWHNTGMRRTDRENSSCVV